MTHLYAFICFSPDDHMCGVQDGMYIYKEMCRAGVCLEQTNTSLNMDK